VEEGNNNERVQRRFAREKHSRPLRLAGLSPCIPNRRRCYQVSNRYTFLFTLAASLFPPSSSCGRRQTRTFTVGIPPLRGVFGSCSRARSTRPRRHFRLEQYTSSAVARGCSTLTSMDSGKELKGARALLSELCCLPAVSIVLVRSPTDQ
jgi:hypothetical protein